MHQLRIYVYHSIGTFNGVLQTDDDTEEGVRELSEALQTQVGSINRLVLVQRDGSEVAFTAAILNQSILTFKVEEVE